MYMLLFLAFDAVALKTMNPKFRIIDINFSVIILMIAAVNINQNYVCSRAPCI